jgi:hypothetical protein
MIPREYEDLAKQHRLLQQRVLELERELNRLKE